jgi:hypothetical protein
MAKRKYKADGKVSGSRQVAKAREIDDILQMNGSNPFGTESEEELKEKLSDLSMVDLQNLAMKANVFPSGSRSTLKNKIIKAHKARRQGKGVSRSVLNSQPVVNPNSRNGKKALEILNS